MSNTVPRTPDELAAVLRNQEGVWEFAGLAGVLLIEREGHMAANRDLQLRFAPATGDVLDLAAALARMRHAPDEAVRIVETLDALLSPEAMEAAVGAPGEAGDAERIQHLGRRLVDTWRQLIDWSAAVRGMRVPGELRPVFQAIADMAVLPAAQVHDWIDELVRDLEEAFDRLDRGEEGIELHSTLTVSIDPAVQSRFDAALAQAERELGLR